MSTSVASVISHFPDAENGFTSTTAGSVASGATTVTLNSVAGYTNGMPVVLVIDPTDTTKKQTFTGIVDTAGVQITSVVWTAGTNQTHDLGATVVDYATATHIAMISKGLLVSHNQDGTLKTGAVTPGIWTNPYKCSVCLSTDQLNLTNNTWTKVLLDSEIYDTNNNFASNKYTAPVAGCYSIKAQIVFINAVVADTGYDLAIYIDGTLARSQSCVSPTTASMFINYTDDILLTANQYIELYARSRSGANTVDLQSSTLYTKMSIYLVSPQ